MPYPMMHLMLFTWRHSASTIQFVQKGSKLFLRCAIGMISTGTGRESVNTVVSEEIPSDISHII